MSTNNLLSPGVQITERDQSLFAVNPNGINTFLAGFAPQGPTEELINVGSQSEFESIFGLPSNDAERYFYHTANFVLNGPNNLIVSRLPYGANNGDGYANQYSVLAFPISADGTVTAVTAISASNNITGVSGVLFENATNFSLLPPVSLLLTDAQYDSLVAGDIIWNTFYQTSATNTAYTATSSITSFAELSKAGLVILNNSKLAINNKYEGYYVGIADNSNINPSTDFTSITGVRSINGISGNVQSFVSVPSSRLNFPLSAAYTALGGNSISELFEKVPSNLDFGSAAYNDCLNLIVFKLRPTIYAQDTLVLDYVPTQVYTGSLYANRTQNSAQGGTATFDLQQLVNGSSSDLKVLVNPNISTLGNWFSGANPNKTVRVSSAAKNLYADGVYVSNTDNTGKNIGNLPNKLANSLALLDNLDTNELDLTLEGGLGTIWVGTNARQTSLSASGGTYVPIYDETFNVSITDLKNQSTGASSNTQTVYSAVVSQFESLATTVRKDHIFIPDALRYIFVQGSDSKQSQKSGFIFSSDIYWPLKNLWNNIASSFVALYGNWVKVNDNTANKAVWVPFSGKIAQIMGSVSKQYFRWTAPAGLNYGSFDGVADLALNPIQKQRDLLYRISVNPVVYFPNEGGYTVWGQKTAYRRPSAFDRINVRQLFLSLEKSTQSVLRYFVFEPNSVTTRARVIAALAPLFEQAKNNNGLYDYKIVCNELNNTPQVIDNNELRVSIYIQATRVAEFVLAEFVATTTGVNLNEIGS